MNRARVILGLSAFAVASAGAFTTTFANVFANKGESAFIAGFRHTAATPTAPSKCTATVNVPVSCSTLTATNAVICTNFFSNNVCTVQLYDSNLH